MDNHQPTVLVCGAGSIGLRHVLNLKSLGARVLLWRSRIESLSKIVNELGVEAATDLDNAFKEADAVVIATNTDKHIDFALKAAKNDCHIFLEKPVSNNFNNVTELNELVESKGLIVEVGCQLRTHPNLVHLRSCIDPTRDGKLLTFRLWAGHRLDAWRPNTDYRKSYSADVCRGGGALFDLIHEIDLAEWLCGNFVSVYADLRHVSELEFQAEDLVNLILESGNGAVGHIQLDMMSPVHRRGLELVYSKAVYIWEHTNGILKRQDEEGVEIVHQVHEGFERNDMFITHMKHFLMRLKDPDLHPVCDIDAGISTLRVALAGHASSLKGRRVPINPSQ